MKPHWSNSIVALSLLALVLTDTGNAGDKKAAPWQPLLPADVYKELTGRSIQTIEAAARSADKDTALKITVEAAILAGYTLSAPNPRDEASLALRGAALAARKQDLKQLADFGKTIKTAKGPADVKDWKPYLPEITDLMEIFRGKSKGGEGISADLQYHPKLKNLNGIESLIGTLAAKKLSDENLAKVAKELPNLAYRVAVVASLTHEYAPEKDTAKWRELSIQMRDASVALARAAHKKNGDGVMQSALALENSCTQCHRDFKKR
jgi:hypothetical protein